MAQLLLDVKALVDDEISMCEADPGEWLPVEKTEMIKIAAHSTPLCWACRSGQANAAEYLVSRKAELHVADQLTWCTPLIAAAKAGSSDVVKILLAKRSNPNLFKKGQTSALYVDCNGNGCDVVFVVFVVFAPITTCALPPPPSNFLVYCDSLSCGVSCTSACMH